jgi:zinc transport system substrate-binding protein
MKLKNTIFILVIIAFISAILMMEQENQKKVQSNKPTIATTTFALYDIAKHITQDSADVFMIIPFGADIHSYEPSPKEAIKIYKSDLLIYSGASLEPWIDGFEFKNKTINISLHVELQKLGKSHSHSHQHHNTTTDPHYWLDFDNMIKATKFITIELISLFPQNKVLYEKNRDNYTAMLKNLDKLYAEKLSTCRLDTIVLNHNAFSYLAKRYNFHVEALSGLSPDAQPSAKKMTELVEHIKEHNVHTVFFESFVSDKAMKSIAKEAEVEVDVLQPLGNITADEAKQKLSYEDIMKQNLQKLSKALECR